MATNKMFLEVVGILLLGILLAIFFNYDSFIEKVAEFTYLERSRVVSYRDDAVWLKITVEGRSYDLFLPYDNKVAAKMKSQVIETDQGPLHHFPGYTIDKSLSELGFKSATCDSRPINVDKPFGSVFTRRQPKKRIATE